MTMDNLEMKEWIAARISKSESGCWEWQYARNQDGYGRFKLPKANGTHRQGYAHRLAYEVYVGHIPQGLTIDHVCRNKSCVNPAHLEVVTSRENTLRSNNPYAKNARKTHCDRGHELSGSNLDPWALRVKGLRQCAACRLDQKRARRQRNHELKGPTARKEA